MNSLLRLTRSSPLFLLAAGGIALAAVPSGPPAEPARVTISVSPESVSAGGQAEITLKLAPKSGIRINRYPKIKLTVPEVEGVVQSAEATLGNPKPPPIDNPESNYFKAPEPLEL